MTPGKVIWIGAGAIVIWVAVRHGWHFVFSPAGAFVIFAAIIWIMHLFGGWEATFRRLMPAAFLIAVGFLVYFGAKTTYCATIGVATQKCIKQSASR